MTTIFFPPFVSPESVGHALDKIRPFQSFRRHRGKDGRHGWVSSTNLGHDWVLAESRQIAVDATPSQVLQAYLSGTLQTRWNADKVMKCQFRLMHDAESSDKNDLPIPYYRQDLVLKSQRVIRRHTGIMRYAQRIVIHQVGGRHNNNNNKATSYCAHVTLLQNNTNDATTTTTLAPFTALHVYVNLTPIGRDTHVYAAGLFQVNRRVIPHLVVFDAAGLAGTLAGQGTLWLAAHFDSKLRQRVRQEQAHPTATQTNLSVHRRCARKSNTGQILCMRLFKCRRHKNSFSFLGA